VKLYGLALVKDEADAIDQSLRHAMEFCHHVVAASGLRTWHPGEALRPRPWRYYLRRARSMSGKG